MRTILLVDLWNVFMVSWHAGANKEARWPFSDTMGRIRAEARKYDHCAIMTDGGRSFRGELDSRWKKNRDEKHAGAVFMLAEVERALHDEGFHLFKIEEMEADDLIATAVEQLKPRLLQSDDPVSITIHSSDRDMLGLLEPGVQVLRTVAPPPPKPGAPPQAWKSMTVRADDVRQNPKIGVDPPKMRDFLVLSDDHNGIKYFPGVGPVHAAKLLNEHGDLATVLSKADAIEPPSIRAAIQKAMGELIEGRPLIDVAVQIVTLRKDAPIDIMTIFQKKEPRAAGPTWDDEENEKNVPAEQMRPGHGREDSMARSDNTRIEKEAMVGEPMGGDQRSRCGASAGPPLPKKETMNDGPNAPAKQAGQGGGAGGVDPKSMGKIQAECLVDQPMGEDKGQVSKQGGGAKTEASDAQPKVATGADRGLIVAPRWELSLEPTTLGEAFRLARMAVASGFWPKHGTEAGCMMIIMAGRARGLTAFDSLNGMHIIEGKPVFGAYLLIGMVQRAKECAYFELVESDEKHALWITKRKGSKTETRRLYTIDQAKTAELVRPTRSGQASNWMKHPEDMLIKTAGAKLTRAAWASITSGAVAAEEMGYE